jgi:adenylate cyclase
MRCKRVRTVQAGFRTAAGEIGMDETKIAATISWLNAGCPPTRSFAENVEACVRRLVEAGIRLDSFSVYSLVIHPIIRAYSFHWSARRGFQKHTATKEEISSVAYRSSPVELCRTSGRMQRLLLETMDIATVPEFIRGFKASGYTDYVVIPMHSLEGNRDFCIAAATRAAGGFSTDEINALRRMSASFSRILEAHLLRLSLSEILTAYIGESIAQRVITGKIARGDGDFIPAVILFADLAGFTDLSNRLKPVDVLQELNTFYDALEPAIRSQGGDVLKFIGDGILAIFETPDDLSAQEAAAGAALGAVDSAIEKLSSWPHKFRAALHVGDIFYGNVGSSSRLDFTAIGPSVNFASRLLSAASEIGATVVCSRDFSGLIPGSHGAVHKVGLKGFSQLQDVIVMR